MTGIGVIGTGFWGKNHVRVFKELLSEGIIDTLKICDSDERRVKELGANFTLEYCTDYRKLLKDDAIDAVSIATPSPTHYEVAMDFLNNEKDVFVEKPLTLDSKQAERLVTSAADAKSTLMVGHIFRYHPAVRELKRRMKLGDFGKVYFFTSNRLDFSIPRRDMGVVFALGIHELDILCYLLDVDYPKEITATTASYVSGAVEEVTTITALFDDGVMGHAMESWLVPVYGKRRDLVLVGSERSARIDYLRPQELQIFDIRMKKERNALSVENTQTITVNIDFKEPLKEELLHFVDCSANFKKPLSDGEVGARAVRMAETALESAKQKKTLNLGD